MSELSEAIKEAAMAGLREANTNLLSTSFSDGTERGAAAASGKYPPNTTEEDGGQKRSLSVNSVADRTTTNAEMRGAAQAEGRPNLSTGNPAPMDTSPGAGGLTSEHVSDNPMADNVPGPSDHVSEANVAASLHSHAHGHMHGDGASHTHQHTHGHDHHHSVREGKGTAGTAGEQLFEAYGIAEYHQPCATCSHPFHHHMSEGIKGQGPCLHCGPKGSMHQYTDKVDFTPTLQTVPLAAANPPDLGDVVVATRSGTSRQLQESQRAACTFIGNTRDLHSRMFTDAEQALIRLDVIHEAIMYRGESDFNNIGANAKNSQADAARDRAETYNAHTVAAHRATLHAFMNGGVGHHQVASDHHTLAADAADAAANDYPDNHPAKKDYKTASNYHNTQSKAHKAAVGAAKSGALPSRYEVAASPFHPEY
jgi:hypothetical protein